MLVVDMRPISMVEDVGFRALLMNLDSRFDLPNRSTFARGINPDLYNKERQKLFDILKNDKYTSPAMPSDIWTSYSQDSDIWFTGHYINEEFQSKNFVFNTVGFPESHTAVNII